VCAWRVKGEEATSGYQVVVVVVVVGCCTQRETRSKVAGNYAMRSFDDGSIDEFDDDVFDQPPPPKLNIVSRYGTTLMIPSHAHTHTDLAR